MKEAPYCLALGEYELLTHVLASKQTSNIISVENTLLRRTGTEMENKSSTYRLDAELRKVKAELSVEKKALEEAMDMTRSMSRDEGFGSLPRSRFDRPSSTSLLSAYRSRRYSSQSDMKKSLTNGWREPNALYLCTLGISNPVYTNSTTTNGYDSPTGHVPRKGSAPQSATSLLGLFIHIRGQFVLDL